MNAKKRLSAASILAIVPIAILSKTASADVAAPPPPSMPPSGSAVPVVSAAPPKPVESALAAQAAAPTEPAPPVGHTVQPPAPVVTPSPADPNAATHDGKFEFGSYGRVAPSIDGRGGPGRDADITARGSRLDEGTYVELELRREDEWRDPRLGNPVRTRIVTTLAVADPLFHYSGQFAATLAVRNLYIEETGIGSDHLAFWVGSRMYRGDDAYLLDWWPLDNLSTYGGGVRYSIPNGTTGSATTIALHGGVNRLDDPFQSQIVDRQRALNQLGTVQVPLLDRPRAIESLRLDHVEVGPSGAGFKGVLYGEAHQLASGTHEADPTNAPGVLDYLPRDSGYVIGAQVGAFTGHHDGHVNLFVRYAGGLAAYGDLSAPYDLNLDKTSSGAHEFRVAFSGNIEGGPFTLMAAGYFRSFRTASPLKLNFNNLDEGALILRPHWFITERVGVFVEGTYERQSRAILNANDEAFHASLMRFGVAPFLSPAGRGSFQRPQIRAIWLMTSRDQGARSLYADGDPFAKRGIEHFFGLSAEWWFNSSYR